MCTRLLNRCRFASALCVDVCMYVCMYVCVYVYVSVCCECVCMHMCVCVGGGCCGGGAGCTHELTTNLQSRSASRHRLDAAKFCVSVCLCVCVCVFGGAGRGGRGAQVLLDTGSMLLAIFADPYVQNYVHESDQIARAFAELRTTKRRWCAVFCLFSPVFFPLSFFPCLFYCQSGHLRSCAPRNGVGGADFFFGESSFFWGGGGQHGHFSVSVSHSHTHG